MSKVFWVRRLRRGAEEAEVFLHQGLRIRGDVRGVTIDAEGAHTVAGFPYILLRVQRAAPICSRSEAAWPAGARAEVRPPVRAPAKARMDGGLRLSEAHQFAAAAAEFEATYALDPRRDVLYVWAQALRLGGQCAKALPLYQQFLDAAPPRAEAERARANLTRCRAELAAAPAPPPAASTVTVPAANAADHPPDPSQAPTPPAGSLVAVPAAPP